MGAGVVGKRCTRRQRWVNRDFWTAGILLDSICVAGWGVGSWGHPCRLLIPLWYEIFVESCVLGQASDIRPCYIRNVMRHGIMGGFGISPGLE